jgi:transketolase
MGLSFAVGEALACKRMGYGNRVFVLVGDGECDEGLIWEAAMSASHFKLDNLVIVVDCNRLQYDGMTAEIMNHNDLGAKFSAFGFYVVNVDGHDCLALHDALSIKMNQPTCVIAHTTKGKGVSFMENNKEWHHHVLSREQYELAKEEVERV